MAIQLKSCHIAPFSGPVLIIVHYWLFASWHWQVDYIVYMLQITVFAWIVITCSF